MITAEEILKPFIETPLRHTKIVSEENALKAMEIYAGENNGLKWVKASERLPEKDKIAAAKYGDYYGELYISPKGDPLFRYISGTREGLDKERLYWLDEFLPCIKCKEREKEVEGLRTKIEFYRTATDKVRELVSNSPDIGAPCQPLYDAIVDKLNEKDARIKELEEALQKIADYKIAVLKSKEMAQAYMKCKSIAQQALKQTK